MVSVCQCRGRCSCVYVRALEFVILLVEFLIIVKYVNPRKGGGGQLSVPPISPTDALPVPPGYTYPQTTAPYAASHYPSFLRRYQIPPRHYYQNQ
ncbi:hypothetical protein QL285_039628 [Trifolium repens]|nr:hypothetical protein QL285_039628 [Trifolium repens]